MGVVAYTSRLCRISPICENPISLQDWSPRTGSFSHTRHKVFCTEKSFSTYSGLNSLLEVWLHHAKVDGLRRNVATIPANASFSNSSIEPWLLQRLNLRRLPMVALLLRHDGVRISFLLARLQIVSSTCRTVSNLDPVPPSLLFSVHGGPGRNVRTVAIPGLRIALEFLFSAFGGPHLVSLDCFWPLCSFFLIIIIFLVVDGVGYGMAVGPSVYLAG